MNRAILVAAVIAALALPGCEGYSEMQGKPANPGLFGDTPAAPPLRIDDPEQPIVEVWVDYIWAKNDDIADRECYRRTKQMNLLFSRTKRTSKDRRKNAPYECWGFENHPEAVYNPKKPKQKGGY